MRDGRDFETETYVSELEDQRNALKTRVAELDAENKRLWAVFKACPGCKRMVPGIMYGCSMQHEIDLSGTCGHREEGDCAAEVVKRMVQAEAERDALKERVAQVEAGAAEIREMLEAVDRALAAILDYVSDDAFAIEVILGPLQLARRDVQAALSSSAGREAAERMRRLEAVAQLARLYVDGGCRLGAGEALRDALRALEGGGSDA